MPLRVQNGKELLSKENLALIRTPARIHFSPEEPYSQNYRFFAMQASMECTAKGRLWSCWIGGADGPAAYLIATYSDDGGETWQDIQFVIDPHSDSLPMIMNTHIGCFWQDPLGRLWLFYQQSFGMWDGEGANFAIVCEDPDSPCPTWSAPRYISIGASLKKPIVTSAGEWLLPVSVWERSHISKMLSEVHGEHDALRGASVYASTDQGETWQRRGGLCFTNHRFNEHSIAELSDGRIVLYSRCTDAIRRSYSTDGGRHWSEEEIAFPHVDSLAMIRTLPSGKLLLIKHGIGMQEATPVRSHLCAYLSRDGGETWEGGLLLDERKHVSYPDIAIAADGTVYVQYDRSRSRAAEILFSRFREEDVLCGAFVTPAAGSAFVIKDVCGIKGHSRLPTAPAPLSGEGSAKDPYRIANAAQWRAFSERVSLGETYAGKHLLLCADIDFSGENLAPVGFSLARGAHVAAFCGHFDGGGHTLRGFVQKARELETRGVFGYLLGGSVRNLRVANALLRGKSNTGALVGLAEGREDAPAEILDCATDADVTVIGYATVGGLIGKTEGAVRVCSCENAATVRLPFTEAEREEIFLGGIVGAAGEGTLLHHCRNTGAVIARHAECGAVGGIAAIACTGAVQACDNEGEILLLDCSGDIDVDELCAISHTPPKGEGGS